MGNEIRDPSAYILGGRDAMDISTCQLRADTATAIQLLLISTTDSGSV
jgi:hypothetical protein